VSDGRTFADFVDPLVGFGAQMSHAILLVVLFLVILLIVDADPPEAF
jgi:hypothetical protein